MRAARFDSVGYRFENLHGLCLVEVFSRRKNLNPDQLAGQPFIGKDNLLLIEANRPTRINYLFYSQFHCY